MVSLAHPDARRIGVISDTHGMIRPEALEALQGTDLILHAGDVGRPSVLEALASLAPVLAVRGNVDHGGWANELPVTVTVTLADDVAVHVLHDLGALDVDPAASGLAAVIYGHSHHASVEERRGVLLLNPGSAGPRRFHLPVTLARVEIQRGRLLPHLVHLEV